MRHFTCKTSSGGPWGKWIGWPIADLSVLWSGSPLKTGKKVRLDGRRFEQERMSLRGKAGKAEEKRERRRR